MTPTYFSVPVRWCGSVFVNRFDSVSVRRCGSYVLFVRRFGSDMLFVRRCGSYIFLRVREMV